MPQTQNNRTYGRGMERTPNSIHPVPDVLVRSGAHQDKAVQDSAEYYEIKTGQEIKIQTNK